MQQTIAGFYAESFRYSAYIFVGDDGEVDLSTSASSPNLTTLTKSSPMQHRYWHCLLSYQVITVSQAAPVLALFIKLPSPHRLPGSTCIGTVY